MTSPNTQATPTLAECIEHWENEIVSYGCYDDLWQVMVATVAHLRAPAPAAEATEANARRYEWLRKQSWVFSELENRIPDIEYTTTDEQFVDDCIDVAITKLGGQS